METLTDRKELKPHFDVVDEDNWLIQSQKEIATIEEGKELLKKIILENSDIDDSD